jgi:hypothetical protein
MTHRNTSPQRPTTTGTSALGDRGARPGCDFSGKRSTKELGERSGRGPGSGASASSSSARVPREGALKESPGDEEVKLRWQEQAGGWCVASRCAAVAQLVSRNAALENRERHEQV